MKSVRTLLRVVAFLSAAWGALGAQGWRSTAAHLGGTARVLLVGTRPEDEDNALIALLSRGRHIETAYLSLTRGEASVNVSGSERGAPLAVVRTAELLAERERDGARQYFTRAFDFGAVDADSIVATAWPRDSLLIDIATVIRAFRPQVVITFGATSAERDATQRFTAQVVADAMVAAGDTLAMPTFRTAQLGAWRPSRLYTLVDSVSTDARVLSLDVGEFDRDESRSYAEIGAEIRRLQRTQPLRAAPTPGRLVRRLQRADGADDDKLSLFAARDTAFARFDTIVPDTTRAHVDTLRVQLAELTASAQTASADVIAARLARVVARTQAIGRTLRCGGLAAVSWCPGVLGDLAASLATMRERATRAMLDAAGIVIDGVAARELVAAGDSVPVTITLRNGGRDPVTFRSVLPFHESGSATGDVPKPMVLSPDSLVQLTSGVLLRTPSRHWWQIFGLVAGTQLHTVRDPTRSRVVRGENRVRASGVTAQVTIGGVEVPVTVGPLVARATTSLRGDARNAVIGVPETSLLLERGAEYERAGLTVNRLFRVFVASYRSTPDTLQVTLDLPKTIRTDSAVRVVPLPPFGTRNLFFTLRGTLPAGSHVVSVRARSVTALPLQAIGAAQTAAVREFTLGTVINEYPHIPSQHFVRFARDRFEAVDVRVPPRLRIGYVRGTEDLRAALGQLRLTVAPIDLGLLPAYDLSTITTLLLGSGALRGQSAAAAIPAVQAFLARGGTVVVLGGGAEVARSGLFPYPIGVELTGGRVANDSLDVRVTDPRSPLLNWPNAITMRDYAAWSGDRTCGRATLVDRRYGAPLGVMDVSGKQVMPAVLSARVGSGTLVHTTLCLAPELDAAQTGAARVIVNLLSAGLQRP